MTGHGPLVLFAIYIRPPQGGLVKPARRPVVLRERLLEDQPILSLVYRPEIVLPAGCTFELTPVSLDLISVLVGLRELGPQSKHRGRFPRFHNGTFPSALLPDQFVTFTVVRALTEVDR